MNNLEKLKDIKPIVEIVDYSLYFFIAIVVFIVLIILIGLYKYFTRITKTKQPSKRKILLKKLKNLDFKDSKNIAYTFSTDGYIFVTAKNQNQFNLIEKRLEQYKYKKDVEAISTDLKEDIKKFIKDIK